MNVKDLIKTYSKELEFSTPVGKVVISKERNVYNALRLKYKELGEEAEKMFYEEYKTFTCFDDLMKHGEEAFTRCIYPGMLEMQKDLISLNVIHHDTEGIFDYLHENSYLDYFTDEFDELWNRACQLGEQLDMNRAYRQARKDGRARWSGATFGGNIVDDYMHQAGMGMRNMAEGAAHSIVNAIGNSIDKENAKSELNSLFRNKSTQKSLADGCFIVVCCMHYALIEILGEAINSKDFDCPKKNDSELAAKLLNNLNKGLFDEEKEKEIYAELIQLNPYNFSLFQSMFEKYGDSRGEIGKLAYHFDIQLDGIKDEAALKFIKENQGISEEDALTGKEKMIVYCKEMSLEIRDDLECVKYINARIKKFDLEYRTVDGIVCSTREAAELARNELVKIQEFMQSIEAPKKNSLLDYEQDLLSKKALFEESFKSELKPKYLGQIEEYLKDFETYFCSMGLFKNGTRKEAGKEKAVKFVKSHIMKNIEDTENVRTELLNMLPKFGLMEEEAAAAIEFIDKTKCEIERKNDLEYRTVDGFECSTREEADLARSEVDAIKTFMMDIKAPEKTALLDYEQDLLEKKQAFSEQFSSELKGKYLDLMEKYLKDFDRNFCTVGFLKIVDRKTAGKERALKYAKSFKVTSKEDVVKALEEIKSMLPKFGLTESELEEIESYMYERVGKSENKQGLFGFLKR